MTGSRAAAAYACNARGLSGSRRSAPAAAWRILRDMMHGVMRPDVSIILDRTDDYVCSACGLILVGDLLEVAGHVHEMHGRLSFVLEECASGPGDCGGGDEAD